MKDISDASFEADVLQASGVVLVDFWAEWCGPCKALTPILEELSKEFEGRVSFGKVNIDDEINTGTKYGIRSIPTLLLFKDGKQIGISTGAKPRTVLSAWIENSVAA